MKTWPTLYQKTQTGAIQQWTISVNDDGVAGLISTEHGQVGGKLQITFDCVREGKNAGKANATTAIQQAEKEAAAKWTKQKKKGYVETIADAEAEKLDSVIEGGVEPMLSPNKSYPKDDLLVKTASFPCHIQPKLDGMRCLAVINDGVASVWSRTRKRIPTVPHIVESLALYFPKGHVILDGELYNHQYKDRFEDLMSILRGDGPDAEGEYLNAQFHVYDVPEQDVLKAPTTMATPWRERFDALCDISSRFSEFDRTCPIKFVSTTRCSDLTQLCLMYEEFLTHGYEGGMYRSFDGKYEAGKRSKHLLKMKEFIELEFPIVGVNDGRGKDAGTVATFDVKLPDGRIVPVRLAATYEKRREYMQKPHLWQGKQLTTKFKRWTADGSLYIPTGKAVRDYE